MELTTRETRRAHDLVRLAVDSGAAEGESRNAALMACRLIAKHGLHIVAQLPEQTRAAPPPPPPPPRRRVITSRFEGICCACNGLIAVGERVVWTPGEGAVHLRCGGRS